ncbi:hypothetical protein CC80DRAFT_411578 [Byssothecium circinans]|uniref:Telomere-associated protein Rif1 N-terminal domain-containing protein n=1 Tax=Byssothecium circinans TaxID=147558 RepID=A0A6A5TVQ4_9PLEO|nr:hypothetical protein CC80DRAFT_411578 [Byssothecium circinans]
MVSKFQSLCVRPPTPPPSKDFDAGNANEDADDLLDFLNDPFATNPTVSTLIAAKTLLNTPQTSPSSDSAVPSSAASRKKRVNFDSVPCAIPSSSFPQQNSTSSPLRPLPQTRVSRPLKSILKPMDAASTPPPADENAPAHKFKSFAEMLESIMKQLASQTRGSRFDAYHALHRTMQAYDKIPDMQALLDKMTLLTQFIQRDAQAVGINGSGLDSQLVGQSLKLLMALVRIPELRSAMSDDFCIFILERIILVASDKEMPKTIVNTHLAMLMQQTFRPKTITTARVERILDFLDSIHDRVSGKSVLAYRIRIYRKLIQQKPEVMAKHTERWFKHTVQALLSPQKDTNQGALDTAITAARAFGADRQVIKAVLTVLNQQKKAGDTIATIVTKELEKMLRGDNAILVPQIWSAVTALLTDSLNANFFPALSDWLKLFHECLNAPDDAVKTHANVAFGFLVHAININEQTGAKWTKICIALPRYQLQHPQRGPWKSSERDAATSAYLCLLYYSLNPLASHKQLDRYWTEFVVDFWSPPESTLSPAHAIAACRVVSALLNGSRRPWDAQRALDLRPQAMIQREELPLLDPRWVRKSLAAILGFVETLLDATPWTLDDSKDEPAQTMWMSLLQSLNVASSQEVMASSESKDAMAHIVNTLRRIWDTHATQLALSQQKEDDWANKFCYLLETTLEKLGAFTIAEKCLARNPQDEIEVVSTPSRSRQQGSRTSPLLFFVNLLVSQSEGRLADAVRLRAIRLLVDPCFKSQNTRLARLEMILDCARIGTCSETPVAAAFLDMIASLAKDCIQEKLDANGHGSRQLGREYEMCVEILALGAPGFLKKSTSQELLTCFTDMVRGEASEGAVVLAVIEKVSERILVRIPEADKRTGLPFLNILFKNLPKMITRRTVEQARQELWPSSSNPGRSVDFDPYKYFYTSVITIGNAAYLELSADDADEVRGLLTALANSIRLCSVAMLAVYLRKVQETICLWVQDVEKRMQVKEQPLKDLHTNVLNLWKDVCAALERLPNKNSQTLAHLEPLITAGFTSRRRGIVERTIATWNATFGKQDTLQYPAQLEQTLRRQRTTAHLSLPSLEIGKVDNDDPVVFYDSDDSFEAPLRKLKSPHVKESPFRITKSARKSRSPAVPSSISRRTSTRSTPKVRLRHDNSQIQFQRIASSPSNPFVQKSQLLTERQQEMFERQGAKNNLYADIGSASSPVRPQTATSIQSPLEIHSDALSGDELPVENVRTPLSRIPPVGPMDVYVGSSPTPHARSRTQEVVSDRTSVATPTAIRTVQLGNDNSELGSSPPRFEKDTHGTALKGNGISEGLVTDSFDYGQPNESFPFSFDEGTTIDENALPERSDSNMPDADISSPDVEASNLLSSTIDLQLSAQINADMRAHNEEEGIKQLGEGLKETREVVPPSAAHPPSQQADSTGNDVQVDETQVVTPTQANFPASKADGSSTSRIGDSFSSQAADAENSQVRTTRRSSRNSVVPSPVPSIKRGRPRKVKDEAFRAPVPSSTGKDELLDNIVVASPRVVQVAAKKTRKSLPASLQSEVMVPETIRKRGITRSASLLSQVETHSEDVVQDTPALKRVRRNINQDVSSAKATPSKNSQAKRLSHVRVTPKGPHPAPSSSMVEKEGPGATAAQNVPSVGEQKEEVAQQLPNSTMASEGSQNQTQSQQPSGEVATPSRSFVDRVILTPRSIINQLKSLKDALFRSSPQLVLDRREEREIDDTLFFIRREIHAAGQRSEEGKDE